MTLTLPLLFAAYVAWSYYGRGRLGVVMHGGLTLAVLWPNARAGLDYARDVSGRLAQFERELAEGGPASELIAGRGPYLHPTHELLTDFFRMLDRPTRVAGATLSYGFANPFGRAPVVTIEWRGENEKFGDSRRHYRVTPTGDRANWESRSYERDVPATHLSASWWMWTEVVEIRIHPDCTPGSFELKELGLRIRR